MQQKNNAGTPLIGRRELCRAVLALCALPVMGQAACRLDPDALSCTDVTGLSATDKATRSAVSYKDKSVFAGKTCDNCIFYESSPEPSACAGCKIVKGPIHPEGYCNAWQPKA